MAELVKSRPSASVVLLGFTDNGGSIATNQRLALERAETVKSELNRLGLGAVEARGMGSILPVASNDPTTAASAIAAWKRGYAGCERASTCRLPPCPPASVGG